MATWLSQNDYVTDKGQNCINAVAAGNGRLAITAVYGSDKFYHGEHPNEATMSDPNILAGVKQQLGGVHCFPAPNSKTAYMVEAQLDTSSDRIAWDETQQKFVATDSVDGYYLRQILVTATYIQYDANGEPYVDDGDENFLMMFAECVKEGDNPDTEKGGADSIPTKDTPRVLHTFAFRIDGFAYLNGELTVEIENTTGAGVVTHTQLQNELARKYTNPNVTGHITHSPNNYTVGDKATKHIARPTKLIESFNNGDTEELVYQSSIGTPPETSIFVPKTDDYTLNILFAFDNVSGVPTPVLELYHKQSDTTIPITDFGVTNYDGSADSNLYIASHTFKNLPEGWNTFKVTPTAPLDGDCGVVAVNLMSGADYSFAYFSTTQSVAELGCGDIKTLSVTLQNVDDRLGFFEPLITGIDDYITAGEVHDLTGTVANLKTEADDLTGAVNEEYDFLGSTDGEDLNTDAGNVKDAINELDEELATLVEEYKANGFRYRGKMSEGTQTFNSFTKNAVGIWYVDKNSHANVKSQLPITDLSNNETVLVVIEGIPDQQYCTQTLHYLKRKLTFKRYVQNNASGNAVWEKTSEIFSTQNSVSIASDKMTGFRGDGDTEDKQYDNKLLKAKKVTSNGRDVVEIVPTDINVDDVADAIQNVGDNLSERTTVNENSSTLDGSEKAGTIQFVSHKWTKTVDSIESAAFKINEVGTINKAVGKWFDGTDITFNIAKLTVPALVDDTQHYALCCNSIADDGTVTLILKVYTSETGITPLRLINDSSLLIAPFKIDDTEQTYSAYGVTIANDDNDLLLDGVLIENSEIRSTRMGGGSVIDASETEFINTTELDAELEGSDNE